MTHNQKLPKPPAQLVPSKQVASFDLRSNHITRFVKAVHIAAAFASTDDGRRALTAIHAASDGKGTVTLKSTDSYRMVKLTLPDMRSDDNPVPAFDTLLPAKWMASQLPKRARLMAAGFDLTDCTITVRDTYGQTSATSKLPGDASSYPNVGNFFEETGTVEGLVEETGFNPKYLADMLRACESWDTWAATRVRSLDPRKPVRFDVVTSDGTMSALLMPVTI